MIWVSKFVVKGLPAKSNQNNITALNLTARLFVHNFHVFNIVMYFMGLVFTLTAFRHLPWRPCPVVLAHLLVPAEENEPVLARVGHLLSRVEQHPGAYNRAVQGQPREPALQTWKEKENKNWS